MNLQEKVVATTADLRTRALALANAALTQARARADVAAKRVGTLKVSLATLSTAGRELNKVARQHAVRFVKQNSAIALDAGKDVSALARSTFASLSGPQQPKSKRATRVTRTTRKRATAKAA
jgi:hypothetical protein